MQKPKCRRTARGHVDNSTYTSVLYERFWSPEVSQNNLAPSGSSSKEVHPLRSHLPLFKSFSSWRDTTSRPRFGPGVGLAASTMDAGGSVLLTRLFCDESLPSSSRDSGDRRRSFADPVLRDDWRVWSLMLQTEDGQLPATTGHRAYSQSDLQPPMRRVVVSWMLEVPCSIYCQCFRPIVVLLTGRFADIFTKMWRKLRLDNHCKLLSANMTSLRLIDWP